MTETVEMWLKGGLSLIAVGIYLWDQLAIKAVSRRWAERALAAMAVISTLAFFNFGLFHGGSFAHNWQELHLRYIHQWDQFHYYLNSKFFTELGYDGLYTASIQAQQEMFPDLPVNPFTRDPRNNQVVATRSLSNHQAEVRARFSSQRWMIFSVNVFYFIRQNGISYIDKLRLDHGFNGSPSWTFVASLFSARLPASTPALFWLSLLDVGLLLVMFYTIYRCYGKKVLYVSLILFGLGYGWRFYWSGGSLLRYDWLAALVCGICMLKKERYTLAGFLMVYAGASRVYPMLFLFGPAILLIRSMIHRQKTEWQRPLMIGVLSGAVLCFVMGSLAGRGPAAWLEFGNNILLHRNTWLTNNVGLRNVLLYDQNTYHQDWVDWGLAEPWTIWQANMYQIQRENSFIIALTTAAFLIVLTLAVWQLEVDEAATSGVMVVFAILLITCYYWGMLLLFGLHHRRGLVVGLLVLNASLYAIHLWRTVFEVIYGAMSWGLLLIFMVYAVPQAVKTIRQKGTA